MHVSPETRRKLELDNVQSNQAGSITASTSHEQLKTNNAEKKDLLDLSNICPQITKQQTKEFYQKKATIADMTFDQMLTYLEETKTSISQKTFEALYPLNENDETRQLFKNDPELKTNHRDITILILKRFGIKVEGDEISAINQETLINYAWLQTDLPKGLKEANLLQCITKSLYLLGNCKLALNLHQFMIQTYEAVLSKEKIHPSYYNMLSALPEIKNPAPKPLTEKKLLQKIKKEQKISSKEVFDIKNFPTSGFTSSKTTTETFSSDQQISPELCINNIHQDSKTQLKEAIFSSVNLPEKIQSEISEDIDKKKIKAALKKAEKAYSANEDISEDDKKIGLKKKLITKYSEKNWQQLTSDIHTLESKFKNELTPFNMIDINKNGQNVNVFDAVVAKEQGISCYSTDSTTHAANLWQTKLFDKNNKEIFSGIRHASLSYRPTDKANKETNQEIVKGKVKELVISALVSKHKAEIENRVNGSANTTPLELNLVSNSLLTLVDFHLASINESEKSQFMQQKQALDELQKELTSVNICGVEIPIKLKTLSFSTGINNFAQTKSAVFENIRKKAWKTADEINLESLTTLIGDPNSQKIEGWTEKFLATLSDNQSDVILTAKITTLATNIKHIFNNKSHHLEGKEKFALPIRILYLSYLIGAVPAFNCKSGKDRTGMIDAQVKALAATLSKQTNIFAADTNVQQSTSVAFQLDPSNFLIQRLNSGLSGNKVMAYDSEYFNNLFTPEQLKLMKGLI